METREKAKREWGKGHADLHVVALMHNRQRFVIKKERLRLIVGQQSAQEPDNGRNRETYASDGGSG